MTQNITLLDQLKVDVELFVSKVPDVRVIDQTSYQTAAAATQRIKALQKQVDERRLEVTKPLRDQVDAINSYAKEILEPLDKAEKHIKAEQRKFADEQERLRQERLRAEAAAREKADREAAEARKRAEDEAEARRAEERRKAAEIEAARRKDREEEAEARREWAAISKTAGSEQKAVEESQKAAAAAVEVLTELEERHERERLAEQARLDREGKARAKEAKDREKAIEAEKIKGVRRPWTFEVTDPTQVPRAYLVIDDKLIRTAVTRGERVIPGVRIFQDTIVPAGAGVAPAEV